MKKIKSIQKLELNRETISHLNSPNLSNAKGGAPPIRMEKDSRASVSFFWKCAYTETTYW